MKFLSRIQIKNFKSFTNETITFENPTCFVGANESGKSNLLDAIDHLSSRNKKSPFSPDELRSGAPDYPDGEIEITYTMKIEKTLLGEILKTFPEIEGKIISLKKFGIPNGIPKWTISSNITQNSIPDIVKINNKNKFISSFKKDSAAKKIAQHHGSTGWFINDKTIDLRKLPYNYLIEGEKIELLKGKSKISFINEILGDQIFKNIKIFKWKFREDDFLQENVNIEELIKNPKKYSSVTNMFLIAGWKTYEFSRKLQGQTRTVYSTLLDEVERQINSLIRKHWTSHNNLKIKIEHIEDRLSIHLKDPGSNTPPEFRSDGLKWFLTFLINFRAQSKSVKNFILLIDEPGLYLHPKGQKDVLLELGVLSKNNQIVYSTHQTFLINKNNPDSVRVIQRETDKSRDVSGRPFYASKVKKITDPKNILTDKLLREALGFQVSDISLINEKNILVEGVFDRDLFHIFNKHWKILNFNEISIISCGSASEITKHCSLYLNNDLSVVCFYDSDTAGSNALSANKKVTNAKKLQISQFIKDTNYRTMEDLIPDTVFELGITEWKKNWKLSFSETISRPRMKMIEPYLDQNKKIEMKHSLEDILVEKVKLNNVNNLSDYIIFKEILTKFKDEL